jgi:hypothetical protein
LNYKIVQVLADIAAHASPDPLQPLKTIFEDADSIKPIKNITDLIDRIENVPRQGVQALTGAPPTPLNPRLWR